jgi:Fe2+ transport system protein FeoA
MSENKLSDINIGEMAQVIRIKECNMHDRFTDLGLVPGTYVKCVGRSPGKDMKAYLIRGAVIALRNVDCQSILISRGDFCLWD